MLVHWKRGKGEPDAAPELLREVTVAVACGNTHSASVTAAGDALTWGSGGFGEHARLGMRDAQHRSNGPVGNGWRAGRTRHGQDDAQRYRRGSGLQPRSGELSLRLERWLVDGVVCAL